MNYGHKKEIKPPFSKAVTKVRQALADEGFGILTEIDVKATLKKKLDVNYGNYIILGACNPPFAHKALETEKDIGLLLPCNVIVYEDKDKVFIASILPTVAMSTVDNPELKAIAEEVERKLKNTLGRIKN